jgi:hypothetical protein
MKKVNYTVNNDEFIIEDYNNAKAFASFLPAIAGLWGKPLWVYYVNRGQVISNFGINDKDGAMLEFVAANKAWRLTSSQGFRTFYKINNTVYEPFKNLPDLNERKISQTMYIKTGSIRLLERNEESGIETEVVYCTLPHENFPALLRKLTIKNISTETKKIECIDGLPMLNPWGIRDWMLKTLSRLGEGWFAGVNYTDKGIPYYKLPVEALDRPEIVPLHGAHFYCGCVKNDVNASITPKYCIDPAVVFDQQMDFAFPAAFIEQENFTINKKIIGKNKTPSGMGYFSVDIAPEKTAVYYSMTGHCGDIENINNAASLILQNNFFERKQKENDEILNNISSCVRTKSANKQFDVYCEQNFIDNMLRGGFPVNIGEGTSYYAYSRVHGDMEREYNNFTVLSEYFSQGNGNYRDVNQNRRSDIFFNQNTGDDNIHFFMNLIQTDGFNPLKVLGVRFVFNTDEDRKQFLGDFSHNVQNMQNLSVFTDKFSEFIKTPFTIGALYNLIENNKIILKDKKNLLSSLLKHSKKRGSAEHGEGYWSDHWHYNTDLIENYLAIFPEKYKELILDRKDYIFYDDCHFVEPRSIKYVFFRGSPRQIRAVRLDPEKASLISSRKTEPNAVRTNFGKGDIYYTNLLGKLLCVIANKYASLDPEALGIEMEGDKPNWCDALNGLPGLFGSSSAESLELLRLVSFLNKGLSEISPDTIIPLAAEIAELLIQLVDITNTVTDDFKFWDMTHTAKENYREKTRLGISGIDENFTTGSVQEILSAFEKKLSESRKKLENLFIDGIIPTCFEFIPEIYQIDENAESKKTPEAKARENSKIHDAAAGTAAAKALAEEKSPPIIVQSFKRRDLPLFLEGPVHYLRLCPEKQDAEKFHRNMLASPLYDKKLGMIKINAPIASAGQDIGRITVFTPGWLENESIWLHMEYKYLLELLRNNLAADFYSISQKALVPFFNPHAYGRSIMENSSFIVSSAHPDESIHGQGFVARLSGATAEFISIWIAVTSGLKPFFMKNEELHLALQPLLPADFFINTTFTFNFLGKCEVTYHNEKQKDTFGSGAAEVQSYRLTLDDGSIEQVYGKEISGNFAHAVRNGRVKSIDIVLS